MCKHLRVFICIQTNKSNCIQCPQSTHPWSMNFLYKIFGNSKFMNKMSEKFCHSLLMPLNQSISFRSSAFSQFALPSNKIYERVNFIMNYEYAIYNACLNSSYTSTSCMRLVPFYTSWGTDEINKTFHNHPRGHNSQVYHVALASTSQMSL